MSELEVRGFGNVAGIDTNSCSACGKPFEDHPGLIPTCRELQWAKASLDHVRDIAKRYIDRGNAGRYLVALELILEELEGDK